MAENTALTDEDLVGFENGAYQRYRAFTRPDGWTIGNWEPSTDVDRLVAEVRRLRTEFNAIYWRDKAREAHG